MTFDQETAIDAAAKRFAKAWYERGEGGRDESTLEMFVRSMLTEAYTLATRAESSRIATKLAALTK